MCYQQGGNFDNFVVNSGFRFINFVASNIVWFAKILQKFVPTYEAYLSISKLSKVSTLWTTQLNKVVLIIFTQHSVNQQNQQISSLLTT